MYSTKHGEKEFDEFKGQGKGQGQGRGDDSSSSTITGTGTGTGRSNTWELHPAPERQTSKLEKLRLQKVKLLLQQSMSDSLLSSHAPGGGGGLGDGSIMSKSTTFKSTVSSSVAATEQTNTPSQGHGIGSSSKGVLVPKMKQHP